MVNDFNFPLNKAFCFIFRSKCAAVILGDTIIVAGGMKTGYRQNLESYQLSVKTAEYLVLGEDTWKKLPEMHKSRVGASACLLP
jgi:hypothetical protein